MGSKIGSELRKWKGEMEKVSWRYTTRDTYAFAVNLSNTSMVERTATHT